MPPSAVPVADVMSTPVATLLPTTLMPDAHDALVAKGISAFAVVDQAGALIGVLSQTDLLRVGQVQSAGRHRAALLTLPSRPISEIMTASPLSVAHTEPLSAAARLMARRSVHRVFVTDGDKLVGVVSTRDIMQVIADNQMGTPISEFMSSPLLTIQVSEPISLATERLAKAHITGLVVVDEDWPVGVFTQTDALLSRAREHSTPVEDLMNPAILCMPVDSKMHRAAAQALAMRARRVIACHNREAVGILSGLDFANAAQ